MKILICSIIRDRAKTLPLWRDQINRLMAANPDIEWHLSSVENSSVDGSGALLRSFQWPGLASLYYLTEQLWTPQYGSIKNEHRCQLLAAQRNKAMHVPALQVVHKILWIEPDIRYDVDSVKPLLYSDADVISGISRQGPCQHYDTWSVRLTSADHDTPADLHIDGDLSVWTTWCQLCVLNAIPIRLHNIRFDSINPRTLHWDNDVISIQESMRSYGYGEIRLNPRIIVEHIPS